MPSDEGTVPRESLDDVAHRTLEHYDRRADAFREGTRDHDVRQNIAALRIARITATSCATVG